MLSKCLKTTFILFALVIILSFSIMGCGGGGGSNPVGAIDNVISNNNTDANQGILASLSGKVMFPQSVLQAASLRASINHSAFIIDIFQYRDSNPFNGAEFITSKTLSSDGLFTFEGIPSGKNIQLAVMNTAGKLLLERRLDLFEDLSGVNIDTTTTAICWLTNSSYGTGNAADQRTSFQIADAVLTNQFDILPFTKIVENNLYEKITGKKLIKDEGSTFDLSSAIVKTSTKKTLRGIRFLKPVISNESGTPIKLPIPTVFYSDGTEKTATANVSWKIKSGAGTIITYDRFISSQIGTTQFTCTYTEGILKRSATLSIRSYPNSLYNPPLPPRQVSIPTDSGLSNLPQPDDGWKVTVRQQYPYSRHGLGMVGIPAIFTISEIAQMFVVHFKSAQGEKCYLGVSPKELNGKWTCPGGELLIYSNEKETTFSKVFTTPDPGLHQYKVYYTFTPPSEPPSSFPVASHLLAKEDITVTIYIPIKGPSDYSGGKPPSATNGTITPTGVVTNGTGASNSGVIGTIGTGGSGSDSGTSATGSNSGSSSFSPGKDNKYHVGSGGAQTIPVAKSDPKWALYQTISLGDNQKINIHVKALNVVGDLYVNWKIENHTSFTMGNITINGRHYESNGHIGGSSAEDIFATVRPGGSSVLNASDIVSYSGISVGETVVVNLDAPCLSFKKQ